ncbi:MAG: pentapeptide repeat-containing protein, partial [Actinobacteria bacterium]|nr:pentapeptide repeat-containing protein [Actinomycetota bacterium]
IRTSFDDVAGFPHARFGGDTIFDQVRFGGPVGFTGANFAQPPRIETVWVRMDGRKLDVDSTWPPGTVIRKTGERPYGVHEGRWGLLVPAPPDDASAQ